MEDKPQTLEQYENEQGEILEAVVPKEGEHTSKRDYTFKVRGYNNNSGMYYLNSGMAQYRGDIRYATDNFSTALYENPSNYKLFKSFKSIEKGTNELPIPEGFELRGGDDELNRPINPPQEISNDINIDEQVTDETNKS